MFIFSPLNLYGQTGCLGFCHFLFLKALAELCPTYSWPFLQGLALLRSCQLCNFLWNSGAFSPWILMFLFSAAWCFAAIAHLPSFPSGFLLILSQGIHIWPSHCDLIAEPCSFPGSIWIPGRLNRHLQKWQVVVWNYFLMKLLWIWLLSSNTTLSVAWWAVLINSCLSW